MTFCQQLDETAISDLICIFDGTYETSFFVTIGFRAPLTFIFRKSKPFFRPINRIDDGLTTFNTKQAFHFERVTLIRVSKMLSVQNEKSLEKA